MLGRGVRTHVCTHAVCLHHGAVYTVHLLPCHPFVYCVWYGVMYDDKRYGNMHGLAYNILVSRRPVALLLLVCVILAPGTSLVTFVGYPSRPRGMTCNILVRLLFYPHLFVFRVLRRRRTPYTSGLAMHGLILAVHLHHGAVCYILVLSLSTSYCVVLATSFLCVARHITYLFLWRPVALLLFVCVLFWGAHKSLAPRARTLLGGFGQATLSFFAVATLLFFF